jgi:hypothetical protein
MVTIDEVLKEIQKNNRVCPQPKKWNELFQMLPNKRRKGNGWEPALPLILAAWWDTPPMSKMLRLQEHIEWASKEGCLEEIHKFLSELKEEDWYHIGD